MTIDLHTHSSVSDGTDAPAVLMQHAGASALSAVALTDHDTMDGIPEAAAEAARLGLGFVPGMEMSTQVNGHSVHLLVYGADPTDPALAAELGRIRDGRTQRVPRMLEKLAALGMPLTLDDVAAQSADASSLGRPHIADALVAKGYIPDRDEAFRSLINDDGPAFVDRYATPLRDALALARGAGGVTVIAHAWSRASRHDLPPRVLDELFDDHGLDGLEVDHADHIPSDQRQLGEIAGRHGALVTGGSDHHGSGKGPAFALGSHVTAPEQYKRLRALMDERASARG